MSPARNPWLADLSKIEHTISQAVDELSFEDRSKVRSMRPIKVATALEKKCHELYNESESIVRERFKRGVYGHHPERKFETSLANSRRARAGFTLEQIFRRMLDWFDIPHMKPRGPKGVKLDFVIPNNKTLRENPRMAVLISLKRQVRERWKLTVGDAYILREIYKFPDNIWFVSLMEPSAEAVWVFPRLGMRIYVPNGYYEKTLGGLRELRKEEIDRIRRFSQVFEDLMSFLKSTGGRTGG